MTGYGRRFSGFPRFSGKPVQTGGWFAGFPPPFKGENRKTGTPPKDDEDWKNTQTRRVGE